MRTCRHCGRAIENSDGGWVDPDATGDDEMWRETCDAHDTFVADHEPAPISVAEAIETIEMDAGTKDDQEEAIWVLVELARRVCGDSLNASLSEAIAPHVAPRTALAPLVARVIEVVRGTYVAEDVSDNTATGGSSVAECDFCAYDGVTVTTHNPDAHAEQGSPLRTADDILRETHLAMGTGEVTP